MTDNQTPEAPNTQTPTTQTPQPQAQPQAPESTPSEEQENRGMPPGYGNGEVTGAGAGAGGSGAAEDYDATAVVQRDVAGIVSTQGNRLDRDYLDKWARELGVIRPALQADLDRLSSRDIPVDVVFTQGKAVLGLN